MDNRVSPSLAEGMRDLQNLLVHLQTVLAECEIPVVRSGGGLTFSGFSFQVEKDSPVDWMGFHIDRPKVVIYQIQDRVLPKEIPLDRIRRLRTRSYERTFSLAESGFYEADERGQMDLLVEFLRETVEYLRGLPPEEEGGEAPEVFIPVLGDPED